MPIKATPAYHAYHAPEPSFSRSLHLRANSVASNLASGAVRPSRQQPLVHRDSSQSTAAPTSTIPSINIGARSSAATGLNLNGLHSKSGVPILETPVSPSSRDSFISILDDPFFQRLHDASFSTSPPAAVASAQIGFGAGLVAGSVPSIDPAPGPDALPENLSPSPISSAAKSCCDSSDSNDFETLQRWSLSRRESLTVGNLDFLPHTDLTMESFDIAIIGADGAGKSTFIQRVLGQSRPPISNASNLRLVVDSIPHMITLLELDIESFDLNTSQPIQWPKQINGHIVPYVDAVLILYDVKQQETLRLVPHLLANLSDSGLPAMMVASKCDQPEGDWEIDTEALASQEPFDQCQSHHKISMDDDQESARACLQAAVRAAIAHRREENGDIMSRKRAQSNLEATDPVGRPLSEGRHSRASSDYSLLRGLSTLSAADNRISGSRSGRMDFHDSFLDVDESETGGHSYSDDIPILQRGDDVLDRPLKLSGIPFDDLVDRLLAIRLTKADANFSDVFLCLYRKFAAPGELFSAILTRLDRVRDDKTTPYMISIMTQLRFLEVLARWVSLYPGDFARPSTRRNLEGLIRQLCPVPAFNLAARQMRKTLTLHVSEDDDTGWAHADDTDDAIATKILSKEPGDLRELVTDLRLEDESSPSYERLSGSLENLARGSSNGTQVHHYSFEDYDREAATLEPTNHLPMNKTRYRIFIDVPEDEIADELTRIDWIMFSSIRIRDFVRHVGLSAGEREACRSLKNVDRMISHFNHIARWVANMILLRDKAKHRAQILEKFMNIAIKLRQLNNYNGLAAVLAGISGTAVHRLLQTRALVSPEVQKKFARLGILMGTQKSHFAYRLAWENSPLPRIPFIPLHRRDLLSAEEGSKTFTGPSRDRINWNKFEVLGEVLLPLMKSQGAPYTNLSTNDHVRELILGCQMPTDEEDIYQRSLAVESSSSGGTIDPTKKMFPWFQNK